MLQHLMLGLATLIAPAVGATPLTVSVVVPRGAPMPTVIEARASGTDVRCQLTAAIARCELPDGSRDVRFSAEGFAPVYLWGMDGGNGGELRFSRGVVVTGYARPGGRDSSGGAIDVELRPATLAWSPADKLRVAAQTRTTKTNERGFFHFDAVDPGEYVVAAKKRGWSPAEYRVHVSGTILEATVGKELVLDALARIEVTVHPPVDVQQRPWVIDLDRVDSGETQPVASSAASVTGQWSYDDLESGSYSVSVRDADGSRVAGDGLYASGGTSHLALSIDQVAVRGTLTLDDEPMDASLRFLDMFGKRVDMESDEDGKFAGTLPKQGLWEVEIRRGAKPSRISIKDVEVRRSAATGYAELALELPAGRLRGAVVDAVGEAVGANIKVWRNRSMVALASTEADGLFDFAGLEPGEVEVAATGKGTHSGMVSYSIRGMDDDPLRIVVGKTNTVRARVVSPDGRPVAGALVSWVLTHLLKDDLTGPDGEVRIALPPSMTAIEVTVSAMGLPLKFATLTATGEVSEIRMPAVAGSIFVAYDGRNPPYPHLGRGSLLMPIGVFIGGPASYEAMPGKMVKGGSVVLVEPGEYVVCSTYHTRCETRVVRAGGRESVDTTGWRD